MGDESAPAAGSTAGRTRARTRARERMADKLAEQRRREREVQNLLEGFLKTEDTISKAADKRDAAIARADAELAATEHSVKTERAAAVAAMRTLGQSVSDIADLTGLPVSQVRSLIQHDRAATKDASTPATDSTLDARDRSADSTPPDSAAANDTNGPAAAS